MAPPPLRCPARLGLGFDGKTKLGDGYGGEIDLQVFKKFGKHYYAGLKFADYSSDGFSTTPIVQP